MDIRIKRSIERLNHIIDQLPIDNTKQFSESLGFKRPERIYKILRGETAISKNLAKIINEKYPQYSVEWLLTGEGSMLKDEEQPTYEPEGKILDPDEFPKKKVWVIPVKGRGGLENAFYDDLALKKLEVEDLDIKYASSEGSKWFKIEVQGVSMDDSTSDYEGSKYSLVEGDWVYCRSIPKIYWKSKLHFNSVKVFCFFHNTRGIIFKKVKSHNLETGDLELYSLNKDKKRFPDFSINVSECSYICNVIKVVTDF